MARILAISSQVVRGHVGNSAATFALQRLGHEVWALPTVILSNHPGHAHTAGARTPPATLREMVAALAQNDWLGEVDAVLTGYLPSAEHVAFAAETIAKVKDAGAKPLILVDPVLGDDPGGLYVAEAAAGALRAHLLPLADILTPNRFELAWLSGMDVDGATAGAAAAARLGPPQVLATSIPASTAQNLVNLLWQPQSTSAHQVRRLNSVPHGTGDLLAALHLGHLLHGATPADAMRRAVAGCTAVIVASSGADELRLVQTQDLWSVRHTG
jgi:pyridoxine kinase